MAAAARPVEPIQVERAWLGAPAGTLANPTVWLLVAAYATLVAGTSGYLGGTLPASAVVALHAVALYVIFTPLHESMHGVAHRHALANEWIGRLAGIPLTITLPLFRGVHFEHHSHTNDPVRDPDLIVARRPGWLRPLWLLGVAVEYRTHFYGRGRYRSTRDWWEALAFEGVLVGVLAAAVAGGWWRSLLVLWLGPAVLAVLVLAFAFDYLPHYPYDTSARYLDTRVYGGVVLNAVLLGQNHHLIHHLWTTIPWFRYRRVFRQLRGQLEARGCRIGWRVRPLPAALGAVLMALAVLAAVGSRPALACHPCVPGEICLGCPHELPLRQGQVILIMAADDGRASWLVKARETPLRSASAILPAARFVGSVRCTGPGCVGRFGRFGAVVRLTTSPTFRGSARFPSGGTCAFSGMLALGDGAGTDTFTCRNGRGDPHGQGPFHIELLRVLRGRG